MKYKEKIINNRDKAVVKLMTDEEMTDDFQETIIQK